MPGAAVPRRPEANHGAFIVLPMDVLRFCRQPGFQEGDYYTKELLVAGCAFVELAGDRLREALSQDLEKHTAWTEQYLLDHGEFLPRRRAEE